MPFDHYSDTSLLHLLISIRRKNSLAFRNFFAFFSEGGGGLRKFDILFFDEFSMPDFSLDGLLSSALYFAIQCYGSACLILTKSSRENTEPVLLTNGKKS